MIRLGALVVALGVALIAVGIRTEITATDPEHAAPPRLERPTGGRDPGPPAPAAVTGADPETTGTIVLVVAYLDAMEQARLEQAAVAAYLDALEQTRLAALAEAARLAAARQAPAPQPASSRAPSPPVTGPCGGATNGADQYIARESGGSPTISNSGGSGAYGCYQIMPATWASSCSDLGPEIGSSPATQAACASRLPLSAWGGR